MTKVTLTLKDIDFRCKSLIKYLEKQGYAYNDLMGPPRCYPIPTGGIPAAYALASVMPLEIVDNPANAEFFIDDIIDSGATMEKWREKYPSTGFFALVDKIAEETNDWFIFPWEGSAEAGIKDHFTRLIEFIGEDPNREGLIETPKRAAKAWGDWFGGYDESPEEIFTVFEDGGEGYDQMIIVQDIPFYSHCEHHIAPIFGTATIAYIPSGKIVGLSKLSRLLDIFARRLQVQERLTQQISETIMEYLKPLGCGVIIKARHLCMESRGISKQGHQTITSSLQGAIKDDPEARLEFLKFYN